MLISLTIFYGSLSFCTPIRDAALVTENMPLHSKSLSKKETVSVQIKGTYKAGGTSKKDPKFSNGFYKASILIIPCKL